MKRVEELAHNLLIYLIQIIQKQVIIRFFILISESSKSVQFNNERRVIRQGEAAGFDDDMI